MFSYFNMFGADSSKVHQFEIIHIPSSMWLATQISP